MKTTLKTMAACMALAAALSLAPGSAKAFIGGDDGAAPAAKHFGKMSKELQLTDKQQQQIRGVFAKNRPTIEPAIKQLRAERRALRNLIHADTIDETAIRAQSAKVAAIQADQAVSRARIAQEVRSVLTPEQIAKANAMQAERDKNAEVRGKHPGKRFKREL